MIRWILGIFKPKPKPTMIQILAQLYADPRFDRSIASGIGGLDKLKNTQQKRDLR